MRNNTRASSNAMEGATYKDEVPPAQCYTRQNFLPHHGHQTSVPPMLTTSLLVVVPWLSTTSPFESSQITKKPRLNKSKSAPVKSSCGDKHPANKTERTVSMTSSGEKLRSDFDLEVGLPRTTHRARRQTCTPYVGMEVYRKTCASGERHLGKKMQSRPPNPPHTTPTTITDIHPL